MTDDEKEHAESGGRLEERRAVVSWLRTVGYEHLADGINDCAHHDGLKLCSECERPTAGERCEACNVKAGEERDIRWAAERSGCGG